ncbi:tRNA (adenosine(37)-N6)-threonylcarbamoyltransferase complex dimerization subunit type 1 TsaB [Agrococcus baldri]|uniref:tRNA (Adenosine(37)-N6)-threonylcarbamoyltransferase complex dimerization subunit type 1 TsaB n=1 Tax=Agrococcus baldri TaxID=153730 RepID=A0AA87RKL2_9MICO|nr:tRNA (adenosine(37)-N6)-threonylcarbamoyltransferase complex dimerization subunit type 1 TsaB [Agrococcus baldri]GEK79857.1 tRNA (adenosine(37)-N6)-threonylcarbamoyltransferase complex dimerization subunit type 1 TsaB [Agrococcus baldri]
MNAGSASARSMTLAIDTSLGTSVAVVDGGGTVVFRERADDTRRHAEHLGGMLERALEGRRSAIELVVAGMGPGAFTGLRVGIAAARATALGLGVPCRGVASHAGVTTGSAQVTTDVRRKERAWSIVVDGLVAGGPHLAPAEAVPAPGGAHAGLERIDAQGVDAALLALAVARGAAEVPQALYLREADAVPSAGPKRVSR